MVGDDQRGQRPKVVGCEGGQWPRQHGRVVLSVDD